MFLQRETKKPFHHSAKLFIGWEGWRPCSQPLPLLQQPEPQFLTLTLLWCYNYTSVLDD